MKPVEEAMPFSQVALGQVTGMTPYKVLGHNAAVTTAEDIWTTSGGSADTSAMVDIILVGTDV